MLELEITAEVGAFALPTNLVHLYESHEECRNYMSVQMEELSLVTEACAEKASLSLQTFPP